jgi:hypothetical protein
VGEGGAKELKGEGREERPRCAHLQAPITLSHRLGLIRVKRVQLSLKPLNSSPPTIAHWAVCPPLPFSPAGANHSRQPLRLCQRDSRRVQPQYSPHTIPDQSFTCRHRSPRSLPLSPFPHLQAPITLGNRFGFVSVNRVEFSLQI